MTDPKDKARKHRPGKDDGGGQSSKAGLKSGKGQSGGQQDIHTGNGRGRTVLDETGER